MALTLQDVREKYPQYSHISDQDLADKLHEKYYSSMDKDDYYKKINFQPATQQAAPNKSFNIRDLPGLTIPTGEEALGMAKNIGLGAVEALGQGGQYIANKLTGGYAPQVDFNQMGSSVEDPRYQNATNIGKGIPAAIAGGESIPGQILAGGFQGASQAKSGNELKDALINAVENGIGAGAFKGLKSLIKSLHGGLPEYRDYSHSMAMQPNQAGTSFAANEGQIGSQPVPSIPPPSPPQYRTEIPSGMKVGEDASSPKESGAYFKDTSSQFDKKKAPIPEALQPRDVARDSRVVARDLTHTLTEGKEVEQQGRDLASHIRSTFDPIEADSQQRYNLIWSHPNIEGRSFHAPTFDALNPEFPEHSDVSNALDNYRSTHSLQSQHDLKQEIGAELGSITKQERFRSLTPEERRLKHSYAQSYGALSNDINNNISRAAPELEDAYSSATENWRKEVLPYLQDKDLKSIVRGQTTNPTTTQIRSIFQNPEPEGAGKVANDIGELGRNRVAHISSGLLPDENSLKAVTSATNKLRKSGLASYLSPEFRSQVEHANQMSENEKASIKQEKQKTALRKTLTDEFQKNIPEKEPLKKFNPEAESNQYIDNFRNQIIKENKTIFNNHNKLIDAQKSLQDALSKAQKEAETGSIKLTKKTIASKKAAAKEAQKVMDEAQVRVGLLQKAIQEEQAKRGQFIKNIGKVALQEGAYHMAGLPGYIVAKNTLK